MVKRIIGWLSVVVLAFGFINALGGLVSLGPIARALADLFDLTVIDTLMFVFRDLMRVPLNQDETFDIVLAVALVGVVYSAVRVKGEALPKRGLLRIPLAAYAIAVWAGTFGVHFVAQQITDSYAEACLHETTTGWTFAQYWELFAVSNWSIEHCLVHERTAFTAALDAAVPQGVAFFIQYLGSTLIIFVLPPVLAIAFLVRRLEINTILAKNGGAILTAALVVFGLGAIDWTEVTAAEQEAPPTSAPANVRAGEVLQDCPECPSMVVVAGGTFTMGAPVGDNLQPEDRWYDAKGRRRDAEWPQRAVTVAPFAVGVHEVSWGEWRACVAAGACPDVERLDGPQTRLEEFPPDTVADLAAEARHPLAAVSWDDAQAYVAWLSALTGERYRLLSEAEWEYAARAGSQTRFSHGDDAAGVCAVGNIGDASYFEDACRRPGVICAPDVQKACDDGHVGAAPRGSFAANAFGVHDMHGNVHEWVEDCYRSRYVGAPTDGSAVTTGDCARRVTRGGSMQTPAVFARSAARLWAYPDMRSLTRGFRVARDLTRD